MRAREHIAQMVSAKGSPTYVQYSTVLNDREKRNYVVLIFPTFSITKKGEENTLNVIIRCPPGYAKGPPDRIDKLPLFAYFNSARFYFST